MAVKLSPILNGWRSFLDSGLPNNGGLVYTYAAGTTTPTATFTDSSGGTPNANPMTLSSAGTPPNEMWLTVGTAYKLVVQDANGNAIPGESYDNISGVNDGTNLSPMTGTGNIVFSNAPTGTGLWTLASVSLGGGNMSLSSAGGTFSGGANVNISSTGTLGVQAGGVTIGSAGSLLLGALSTINLGGGQIVFPATANLSSNANTLDDYEEGTWIPSLGGSATYTARNGTYQKVGNTVTITGAITVNAIGTGSTSSISGLPFVSSTIVTDQPGWVGYFLSLSANVAFYGCYVPTSATTVSLTSTAAAASSTSNAGNLTSSSTVTFGAIFRTQS